MIIPSFICNSLSYVLSYNYMDRNLWTFPRKHIGSRFPVSSVASRTAVLAPTMLFSRQNFLFGLHAILHKVRLKLDRNSAIIYMTFHIGTLDLSF